MGNEQTLLQKHEFTLVRKINGCDLVKSKDGNQYLVRLFNKDLNTLKDLLRKLEHPHIVGHLTLEENGVLYVLTEHWEGETLAQKIQALIQEKKLSEEKEVMDWFLKICMALSHLHDNKIVHKNIRAQNIFLTDCGMVRLGMPEEITERAGVHQDANEGFNDMPPEVMKGANYNAKSDMWRLGCLLYELCIQRSAFTAQSLEKLFPKIFNASYEALPDRFSTDLRQLLSTMLQPEPENRPPLKEILWQPFTINCLVSQGRKTHAELQGCITKLRALADGLEKVHVGTTVGSLAGGVVGAAGGITSIVGLILAPFTLGTSLIVTGVGVGVAVAGGAAAGVANITNMVNQSSDRRSVRNIITEFQEKLAFLASCLKHIGESQEVCETAELTSAGEKNVAGAAVRLGKGLGAIPQVLRIANAASAGKVAAQAARVARVAEVAAGVFAGLFLAVDIFFIAMDAKEIHNIRTKGGDSGKVKSEKVKSELMKFVASIREKTNELETIVKELDIINN